MKNGIELDEAVNSIYDNVRYTSISSKDDLVRGFGDVVDKLQEKGYNVFRVKNTLKDTNASYRGVNTIVENEEGYKFELQFHTKESFNIKQENHILYEEQRLDNTSEKRKNEINIEMKKNNKIIDLPKAINSIQQFNKLK
ncbi:MAG: hypothetical protein RR986_01530 [Longicatena sp.]